VSHVAAAAMLHLVILLVLTFSIDWSFVEPAPRKARTRTKGILLDKMTRSMKSKLPITVADGFKRPHDPVQAAKFASEAGVVVRDHVPVFTHWKHYKEKENKPIFDNFIGKLGVSSFILSTCCI